MIRRDRLATLPTRPVPRGIIKIVSLVRPQWLVLALIGLLAMSVYVVPANEKAIVKRFGAVVLPPRSSGLHFDWPWPLARVERVNFNEVRTLVLGDLEADPNFLQSTAASKPSTFLTGDKNLLLLRITVQYRISEDSFVEWLYRSRSSVQRLQTLVETTTADLVSRSGVDFVHTQGLADLNNRLLQDVRRQVKLLQIGCDVEQVTVDRAEPPARVKAEFLDVSNARADMVRTINDARGYAEQVLAESQADARRLIDNAERDRLARESAARGAADRFVRLVTQIQDDARNGGRSYADSRQLVMNRLTIETIRDAFEKSKVKVVLDGDRPFDLTFPK